jgi:hypothetical protein
MDSADKTKWYQKKAFGIVLAGVFAALRVIPGKPPFVDTLIDMAIGIAGGYGIYGFVEVVRSNAAATKMLLEKPPRAIISGPDQP